MAASESEEGSRPRRANELGPTGNQLAENVKALREDLRLTTEQLAKRVTALGRPMRGTTITRIEKKQRRIDVDDLAALALALGVNVSALLLPPTADGTAEATGLDHPVSAFRLWAWASGDAMLPLEDDPAWEGPTDRVPPALLEQHSLRWWQLCKPHREVARASDWARYREQLDVVLNESQQAVNAGLSIPVLVDLIQETLIQPAVFKRVNGSERVWANVGSFEYNRMSHSDQWQRLSDEQVKELQRETRERQERRKAQKGGDSGERQEETER